MKANVLIRCDASLNMGTGHIIRCRTLARQLVTIGFRVIFICRKQRGDLIHILNQEFEVIELPINKLANTEGLSGRELYKAWLGCDQIKDAFDSITGLKEHKIDRIDWIILDHYGIDRTWENWLRKELKNKHEIKLLVIDDLADRMHEAELLLDQNYFGNKTFARYNKWTNSGCRLLLGPLYALLGDEYSQIKKSLSARTEIKKILILYGGNDKYNLTEKAVRALADKELRYISIDVVLGIQSEETKVITQLVGERINGRTYTNMPSLAGLMAKADLAIGGGGSTTWERACLGLPSIVTSLSANQEDFNNELSKENFILLTKKVNDITPEYLKELILEIKSNRVF